MRGAGGMMGRRGAEAGLMGRRGTEAGLFSPFSLMRRMFEDLDNLSSLAGFGRPEDLERGAYAWIPRVDVTRRDDRVLVNLDLPGVAPDQVRVTVTDDALIVEGERTDEDVRDQGDVVQLERTYGTFRRVIPLPDDVDPNSLEARLENGQLQISMRVSGPQRGGGRNIPITPGDGRGQRRGSAS